MFHLAQVGLMPKRFRIIGAARKEIDVEEFRELARESVGGSGRKSLDSEAWHRFADSLRFAGVGAGFEALGDAIAAEREDPGSDSNLLYYLSLPPNAAAGTVEQIGALGL